MQINKKHLFINRSEKLFVELRISFNLEFYLTPISQKIERGDYSNNNNDNESSDEDVYEDAHDDSADDDMNSIMLGSTVALTTATASTATDDVLKAELGEFIYFYVHRFVSF